MTAAEIRELLARKDWSRADLAHELQISESAIAKWLAQDGPPKGPANVLMRIWLAKAREVDGAATEDVPA